MAELVDALGSGPSGGNTVEVRVLFWAPQFNKMARVSGPFLFCACNKQSSLVPELDEIRCNVCRSRPKVNGALLDTKPMNNHIIIQVYMLFTKSANLIA